MIVINKTLHPHDSPAMINKMVELSKLPLYTVPEIHKLPHIFRGQGRKKYQQSYRQLPLSSPLKRRNLGLSLKSFKNKKDYSVAAKKEIVYLENKVLKDFIGKQLNGGFGFDEVSVVL